MQNKLIAKIAVVVIVVLICLHIIEVQYYAHHPSNEHKNTFGPYKRIIQNLIQRNDNEKYGIETEIDDDSFKYNKAFDNVDLKSGKNAFDDSADEPRLDDSISDDNLDRNNERVYDKTKIIMKSQKIDMKDNKKQNLQCKKETNIGFLKTHKTGGSTVTSLINRFADINNLLLALPQGSHMFKLRASFTAKYVNSNLLKNNTANIINNHMLLNKPELDKVMNKGYKLITILRDPVAQVRSLYFYFQFNKLYNLASEDHFVDFFKDPFKHFQQNPKLRGKETYLKNGMSYDLNFDHFQKIHMHNNSLSDFIKYLDKIFDFVIITEFFDESLLLLKQRFCWNYFDIMYEKKLVNQRVKPFLSLPDNTRLRIYAWSYMDSAIYRYFLKKLMLELRNQNTEDFQKQLAEFTELKRLVSKFCYRQIIGDFTNLMKYCISNNIDIPDFVLVEPGCFCDKLKREEIAYYEYFNKKQANKVKHTSHLDECS